MKLTCIFSIISCLLFSVVSAQGGASVTFQELESVTKSNPDLSGLFGSMNVEKNGESQRLGRHFGNVGGARVGPYRFGATFKEGANHGQPFELVLHTRWHLEDASGKRYEGDPPQPPPASAGEVKIVEVLERVEMISLRQGGEGAIPSPTPTPDPAGEEGDTSALWNGTWNSIHGELRLVQDGRRVYGDYSNRGYFEARTDQNNPGILRGTYQYFNGKWGLFEFKINEERKGFSGTWANESIPNAASNG